MAAAVLLVAPLARGWADQPYPHRPVTVIVPFSAGTGPDIVARIFAQKFAERVGVAVVVDNKPGASSNIGTELAAKAAGDGYTLMMTGTTFALNPALRRATPYDPVKSFAPVGIVATGTLAFAVSSNTAANNIREFVALARSRPGELNYASPGNGTPQHLAMELFKLNTGIVVMHVPYKETAGAIKDLAGGFVNAMIVPVYTVEPVVRAGRARILAVLSEERSPVYKDSPTLKEEGVPDVNAQAWVGLMAPASTPRAVLDKLNGELNAIIALPDFRATLGKQGLVAVGGTPEALAELVKSDLERWRRVIAEAKIIGD